MWNLPLLGSLALVITASAPTASNCATPPASNPSCGAELTQDDEEEPKVPGFLSAPEWDPEAPRGLLLNAAGAWDGLTFLSPINSTRGFLLEMDGTIVHEWQFDSAPGEWAYLQNDGTLVRGGRQDEDAHFSGGGIGGILQRVAPDGTILWQLDLATHGLCSHHDIAVMPNGDILAIAWERIPRETAIASGRDPAHVGGAGLWPDTILQLRPRGTDAADLVWQWRAWDHIVQDFDPRMANYGDVTAHPGRLDVNGDHRDKPPMSQEERERLAEEQRQLEALGYTGGVGSVVGTDDADELERRRQMLERSGDFMHTNGIDYLPSHDLIVISSPEYNELFVIDHSTTIEEARGSTGGRLGRGGEILYRFGNPKNYGRGSDADQHLFYQHDPKWLVPSSKTDRGSELRLTVFNNGGGRGDRSYSTVEELVLPFDPQRGFELEDGEPFGPTEPIWSYDDPDGFYSAFISGAERLPNGNTLICSGAGGRAFEVKPDGTTVWNYKCDLGGEVEPPDHAGNAPKYSMFRVTRYARDHSGIKAILAAAPR